MSQLHIEHMSPAPDSNIPENHRVLIVDNESAICFAYSKLLEGERFGFDICETVDAALSCLKVRPYFAVISDVRFTGSDNRDGVHFVSIIRQEQPQAKVILVTGYGDDDLKSAASELGAHSYFEKPIRPELVLSLLRSMHADSDKEEYEKYKMLHLSDAQVSC